MKYPSQMSMIQQLTKFLNAKGEIYSVRKFKYTTDECYVHAVGNCKRQLIYEFDLSCKIDEGENIQMLLFYLSWSGFDNITDWLVMIRKFVDINNTDALYLYRIRKE